MIDPKIVEQIAVREMGAGPLFLIGVTVSPASEIEVTVDSDTSVDIDDCVALSRAIEGALDREAEDFSLTVASAGIGQPLKVLRQYKKLIGQPVEVVLKDGGKVVARLDEATAEAITLTYPERQTVEGTKKKKTVEVTRTFLLAEVKSTAEYLDFK